MSFRLFDVNVEIQVFFWITAVLLGYPILQDAHAPRGSMLVWVLVVLVSILIHEFGHAFAVKRHRIEPEIALHGMGGTTSWRPVLALRRLDMVVISAAGPFAGFLVAGILYATLRFLPGFVIGLPPLARFAFHAALEVNWYWGIFNLIPVLPFDGGHILEHVLGPKRARLTAGISFVVGMLAAAYFAVQGSILGAMLLGLGAIKSYQRYRAAELVSPAPGNTRKWAPPPDEAQAPEVVAILQSARHALVEERFDRAMTLAQQILDSDGSAFAVSRRCRREALEVIAWAHLLESRLDAASETLARAKKHGDPDAALTGAVLLARRELSAARRALEEARAAGDDRKEVVGPLIQILLEQGEVTRAAAVALDIIDSLSTEDARKMAQIAFDHGAFDWSARLFAAAFERQQEANDAYDAARALALAGDHERALEWLRKAVGAGFSDPARAWSDAALEALRASRGLETVLPRP
jgi:Zn-dependent protease